VINIWVEVAYSGNALLRVGDFTASLDNTAATLICMARKGPFSRVCLLGMLLAV
jgi:hypothetical protein